MQKLIFAVKRLKTSHEKRYTTVHSKISDKDIMKFLVYKEMAYSLDLREKAVSLVKKGKSKDEVAELLEIATLYRWLKKKSNGKSFNPTVVLY